ncbi:MAG: branched-chain amino acid ABC transporter permease [Candidatus Saccharibacteria bacterium]
MSKNTSFVMNKLNIIFPVITLLLIMTIPVVLYLAGEVAESGNNYILSTLIFIGIYSIVTVSMCLLMGYAGQISLGHAAFFGMGAYGSAILTTKYAWNPWLALAAAAVVTGVLALIVGIPTLKLKEHYLALATLGFGIIVSVVFAQETEYTGGPSGITGIPSLQIGGHQLNNDLTIYYLVWLVVLITIFIASNIVKSRVGRALQAIHGSETAAEAMGINTSYYKLQIFVVSAVFASVAGSFFVHYITAISPNSFGFKMSIEFVLMAVVGGIASNWGPLFGVATVFILTQFLQKEIPNLIPNSGGEVEIVAFGVILAIIMIFMPEGLFRGIVDRIEKRGKVNREPVDVVLDNLWEEGDI